MGLELPVREEIKMRASMSMANGLAAMVIFIAQFVTTTPSILAADKALYQMDTATIDARIRAAFTDPDPFAGAKIVGQLFAENIDIGGKPVPRDAILTGLEKESLRFREQMPDFRIAERDLFVASNGVVMTGRMMGTRADGTKMDTAFVTVFTRDKSGRIVTQSTLEMPRKN